MLLNLDLKWERVERYIFMYLIMHIYNELSPVLSLSNLFVCALVEINVLKTRRDILSSGVFEVLLYSIMICFIAS